MVRALTSLMLAVAPMTRACAQESPREGPVILRPAEAGIGRLIPDVAFTDIDGNAGRLSDFIREWGLVRRYVHDRDRALVAAIGAETTAEG